jgi:hypothetical protein
MEWFIPSVHGDIRLEKLGKDRTKLHAYELTGAEEKAMGVLRDRAIKSPLVGQQWASPTAFLPLTNSAYRGIDGVVIELATSLEAVEKVLSEALKPGRDLVRAVRFQDGRIVEVETAKTDDVGPAIGYRDSAKAAELKEEPKEEKIEAKADPSKEEPKAAVTVAAPNLGCPMPDFPEADIRASRVLETFLTEAQRKDYRSTGAFLVRGVDTGRRYMVCNRESPGIMRKQAAAMGSASFRQLYDLDRNTTVCVHDWTVPPPEEMLGLMLCLTLPGRENAMLKLPEMDPAIAMLDVDPRYRPAGW